MREVMGEAVEERKNLQLLLLSTIVISLKAQQPLRSPLQIVRPRLARLTSLKDILAHVS